MTDTPKHIKDLQLKIWLSKSPMERLKRTLEDNDLNGPSQVRFDYSDFRVIFDQNTNMGAQTLDKDFLKYWMRLSVVEKQSLFQVAKHYVELKDDTTPISVEQYNAEIDEAMKRMDAGELYTHEQVKEMSKGWLNGK